MILFPFLNYSWKNTLHYFRILRHRKLVVSQQIASYSKIFVRNERFAGSFVHSVVLACRPLIRYIIFVLVTGRGRMYADHLDNFVSFCLHPAGSYFMAICKMIRVRFP